MNMMSVGLDARKLQPETEPVLSLEQVHLYRSKIVDKCAEAERHVLCLLQAAGGTMPAKALLSQKLEALKKLLTQETRAIRPAKIRPLLDQLQPLSDFRSELVHSTLSVAEVEGACVAILRNAAEPKAAEGARTILTLSRIKNCHQKLSQLVNSLRQEAERAG